MFKGGYTGKVLRINLTDQTTTIESLSPVVAKDFIGGAGFGIKYLFDEVPAKIDALGPENKLIFAPGPFSGTNVPCASRMAVTAKSPLTGAVGMALSGGYFPVELKFAGYDILIVEGESKEPVYLWIKDGEVKFRSAKKLWGMKTTDTQQIIKNDLKDQNIRVACIGPAGENQIKIASIINEWRAVGRKGLGAVMGSKNLKAIAIRGTDKIPVADKEKLKAARKEFTKAMKESHVLYPAFSKIGTPMVVDHTCHMGIFPTKNYTTTGEYDPIEKIGTQVQATRNVGKEHCYGCPVGCSQVKLAKTGEYAGTMTEGPEFETMYSFGGVTGVENIDTIIMAVVGIAAQNTAALMEAVTDLTYSQDEVLQVGERINNLARAYNVREGLTRADDTLPDRLMDEKIPGGASKGHSISRDELKLMLDEYYTARGWDIKSGSPTKKKLKELNLEYVADQLGI